MTLIALNKPYLVHSKFTDDEGRPTLATFGLPPRVYVAGRLDHEEGLGERVPISPVSFPLSRDLKPLRY